MLKGQTFLTASPIRPLLFEELTVESLRKIFMEDMCIPEAKMPASPEADLRQSHGGPIDEDHLDDFIAELASLLADPRFCAESFRLSEKKGLRPLGGHASYFSLTYFASLGNSPKPPVGRLSKLPA